MLLLLAPWPVASWVTKIIYSTELSKHEAPGREMQEAEGTFHMEGAMMAGGEPGT